MTLHQAISNATKANVRVCHPKLEGGKHLSLEYLQNISVPIAIAAGNEWELEARTVQMNEHTAKTAISQVLRRYIMSTKIDEVADAIIAEFFLELS